MSTGEYYKKKGVGKMGCYHDNWVDDTTIEFPRTGFWIIHAIGAAAIFFMGMRFAVRRIPLPLMTYRMVRRLMRQ